jgi:hypothetical protein
VTEDTTMRVLGAIAAALHCAAMIAEDAHAQRRDRDGDRNWVELGCREVDLFGADRDTIRVGRREGKFKAIRLEAKGNDVEILDLKVVYANGQPDDIKVRSFLKQGSRTRTLDLRGRGRSIQQIDIVYRKPLNFRGKARVCVEALD